MIWVSSSYIIRIFWKHEKKKKSIQLLGSQLLFCFYYIFFMYYNFRNIHLASTHRVNYTKCNSQLENEIICFRRKISNETCQQRKINITHKPTMGCPCGVLHKLDLEFKPVRSAFTNDISTPISWNNHYWYMLYTNGIHHPK